MQKPLLQKNALLITQLCLMVLIGRVAFDIYVPALPVISHQLQSNADQISLTMSLFSLGFGLSQLIYGPLSDRFGRRYVVLFGFLVFIGGSFFASMVDSITQLYWARFIIGCGAGVGVVISRAMARDLYVENALAKVCAIQSLILTLGLFIAPILGGYLLNWFGWRSQFLTLSIFGIMCLALFLYHLPETNQAINSKKAALPVIQRYVSFLQDKVFMAYAVIVGLSFAGLVAYFQLSTFIFQRQFEMSAISYGWLSLVIVVAYIIGTLGLEQDLKSKSLAQVVKKGCCYMAVGSLILLTAYACHWTPISVILFTTMLYVYGLRLIMPSATSICLSRYAKGAGSASALLGAIIMLLSAAVSALLGMFNCNSILLLGLTYLALAGLSFLALNLSKNAQS